jgi:hypothetical protein
MGHTAYPTKNHSKGATTVATSIQQELAAVEQEIARLEIIRDYLRSREGSSNGAAPRRRRARRQGKVTAAQAAETVLSKASGPMRVKDLLVAVQAEGAQISDGEGLSKTLTRNPKFVRAGRGLWTLADGA